MTRVTEHPYRLLNVFTVEGDPFSGNPLCVFDDGERLDPAQMQPLARQFNLSETVFLLPSTVATARLRIFTPAFEMPFAGHPTLGAAHVVRALRGGDTLTLETLAGVVPVSAVGDEWTLVATARGSRVADASRADLAAMLGLDAGDLAGEARWVDAGSEQLVIPLLSAAAVRRSAPDGALLRRHGALRPERCLAYVWAEDGAGAVTARFFFLNGTAVVEDPATGSACANLGGWFLAQGTALPIARTVSQGDAVARPSRLRMRVTEPGRIAVSGTVHELGRGTVQLPA